MEAAPATTPTETKPPLTSLARFMTILHKLIDYGERLTNAFQRAGNMVDPADRFLHFGTTDLRLILARIKRGLLRARVLQMALQNDPTLLKDSLYDYPDPREPGSHPPGPRPAPRHTRAEREEAENAALLARLPTAQEIAEQIRHRTPGDVLLDICLDLGLTPSHPLYMELSTLALVHAGNTVRVSSTFLNRLRNRHRYAEAPEPQPPALPPPPPETASVATGPP